MPYPEKVGTIAKGIRYLAFNILVFQNPTSVAELVTLCKTFQAAQNTPMRLPQALLASDDTGLLWTSVTPQINQETMRNVVRERLAHLGLLAFPPARLPEDITVRTLI